MSKDEVTTGGGATTAGGGVTDQGPARATAAEAAVRAAAGAAALRRGLGTVRRHLPVGPVARRRARTAARVAAWSGAGAVAATSLAAAGMSGLAAFFVRRVVTPVHERPDDVRVLAVDADGTGPDGPVITVTADAQTRARGRYVLLLDGGRRSAQVGDVVREEDGAVVRQLLSVPDGGIAPGPARWSGVVHVGDPTAALGLPHEDVLVPTPLGGLPAWFVPAQRARATGAEDGSATADDQPAGAEVWAVLVHGRGATREECLRAVPLLHRLGLSCLVPAYRNDADAPVEAASHYGLGDTEWLDVEAAVLHALDHGAREVVLVGWSMGGAIVLQLATRSWTADRVRALVLDSPVVDWRDVLEHAARQNRLPQLALRLGIAMLARPEARALLGVSAPIDITRLDWVVRADELHLPALLLHAGEDDVVPIGPSRRLAAARPDLVVFRDFPGAQHTKEWNTDPDRWEREVARFLLEHL
ncbi:alpha/beta hydrolase [uncultured Pseudokineococcus sp.]|uniref:alpha/beta hydrolase n=1 Tax=uncultured Pseudokineococcus sp. TaxID=1642928 RepID=UPI002605F643|nr:alpha/beta fold hydrolase [uncultured Pseudokineococcus sp.]